MRRVLAFCAAGVLASTLVACASGNDTAATSSSSAASTSASTASDSNVLNIYSSRHYDVDKEIYALFEKETGVKLNVVEGKSDELLERITREKSAPAADLFLTVGAESIYQLKSNDLIENSMTDTIEKRIPEKYRGDDWMGIVSRARVVAYNKDTVNPDDLKTYADLTDPKFKGKVLVRSSSSSYNQALLASFIAENGEEAATTWAQGVVDNFAREPKGNDRDQAAAVAAGEGDVAIMNSYYYAQMLRSSDPEVKKVADKVALAFPENTHVNLSYGAVLNGAKNKDNALKFLEFMTSKEVQEKIATENGEFPLSTEVTSVPEPQGAWLPFSEQNVDFEELGKFKPEATLIFDKVGWK